MAILTRDQILNAKDLQTETVAVPEWGGEVVVRSLTGAERDEFEARHVSSKGGDATVNMRNARAHLVSLACVGTDGERIFTPADIAALGKKNAAALDRVFSVAMRLSGIGEQDMAEITEEIENSPFGALPTD